jgi:hypothetical protein
MTEKPKHAKRARWPAVVMALVLVLPPLYVASFGPVYVWGCRIKPGGWQARDWFLTAYAPIYWAADRSPTVDDWVERYQWWCIENLSTSQAA